MNTHESLREVANLRLRFQINNRLRLESLAALSKVLREHGEPVRDELLASLVFAIPEELLGEGKPIKAQSSAELSYPRPPDTKPPDTKPPDTKPPDTKPPDTKPPDTRPPDTKPPDTRPPDTRPPDTQSPSTRPPDGEAMRPPDRDAKQFA